MRGSSLLLFFACALLGCGAAPGPEPTTPPPSSGAGVAVVELDGRANAPAAALPAHSLWRGRYACAQGVTGLDLTLDLDGMGQAAAVFDFGPAPENPSVPSGRYLMRGRADPGALGTTHVTLLPDRWIAQPPGYVMVGLSATIEASVRAMQGRIDHPDCTVLSLSRVQ